MQGHEREILLVFPGFSAAKHVSAVAEKACDIQLVMVRKNVIESRGEMRASASLPQKVKNRDRKRTRDSKLYRPARGSDLSVYADTTRCVQVLPLPQGQRAVRETFLSFMVFLPSDSLSLRMAKRTLIEGIVVRHPERERHEPDEEQQPNRRHHWHCFDKEKDRFTKTTNPAHYFFSPHRPVQEW